MYRKILRFLALSLVTLPASAQCGSWSPEFGSPGANAEVRASAIFDDGGGPRLYIAGAFTGVGGVAAQGVARWNGSAWSAVGSGLNGVVTALAVIDYGAGPMLAAAAVFSNQIRVVTWDGTQWSPYGAPMTNTSSLYDMGEILTIAVHDDGSGPRVYVGGAAPTFPVRRWDGVSWSSPGGGLQMGDFDGQHPIVSALVTFDDGTGPKLYAGGRFRFTNLDTPISDDVARWNGTAWTSVGSGVDSYTNVVSAFAIFDDGGGARLVAGVASTAPSSPRLMRWNGTSWSAYGANLDGDVNRLEVFGPASGVAPGLWAAGTFHHAGSTSADGFARFDGSTWSAVGGAHGMPAPTVVEAFDDGSGAGPRVFAADHGGTIEVLQSGVWSPLLGGQGANDRIESLATLERPGEEPLLFAFGEFTTIGDTHAFRLAHWDGTHWQRESIEGSIYPDGLDVLNDGNGPAVYVCGVTTATGPNVFRRDSAASWVPLPRVPMNWAPSHLAMLDLGAGPQLYAADYWGVWRLDGAQWTNLFGDVGAVDRIVSFDDGSGPALFVSGNFTSIAGTPCGGIARWNGTAIDVLGGGLGSGYPTALAVLDDGTGPALFAGGGFTMISGVPCRGVAKWNGLTWSAVGNDPSMPITLVQALTLFDDGSGAGQRLVAAGQTLVPADYSWVPKIAVWDGSTWAELGGGISGAPFGNYLPPSVVTLATFDDHTGRGPDLFAGGSFLQAGTHSAQNIARWTSCGGSAETFCYGDGSATACPCGNASAIGADAGCLNSFGTGGTLRVRGRASIADDTLELLGAGMTNSSALYYQAANVAFGGQGFVFGDGIKCTAGPFVRLRSKVNTNGMSSYPNAGDLPISIKGFVAAPGTRYYQVHYRNSAAFCTPDTFNHTNAVRVDWGP